MPIPVLDTVSAVMKARSVMAGVRLGVFTGLSEGARTAADSAGALQLDGECLELLLRTRVFGGWTWRGRTA